MRAISNAKDRAVRKDLQAACAKLAEVRAASLATLRQGNGWERRDAVHAYLFAREIVAHYRTWLAATEVVKGTTRHYTGAHHAGA